MNEVPERVLNTIPSATDDEIAKVKNLGSYIAALPQVKLETLHTLHDGVYTRSVMTPAGVLGVGVLIKIPTTLIISGDATAIMGDRTERITGHHVVTAGAHRQQAFYAHDDTWVTMIFATDARTIEEAEEQFTDEVGLLMSRREDALNTIMGEDTKCLV